MSTTAPRDVFTSVSPRFAAAKNVGADHAARRRRRAACAATRRRTARRASSSVRRALDVGREVAIDQERIARDDPLEHVARDVRHPLADAPEADDAERQFGRPAQRARRQVVPLAVADVVVVARRRCAATRAPAPAHASRLRRRRSPASSRPRRRAPCRRRRRRCRSRRRSGSRCRVRAAPQRRAAVIGAYCSRMPTQPRAASITCASWSALRDFEFEAGARRRFRARGRGPGNRDRRTGFAWQERRTAARAPQRRDGERYAASRYRASSAGRPDTPLGMRTEAAAARSHRIRIRAARARSSRG